jgi:hypothetical protein
MPDYKEMYFILFRAQTKAIELLQKAQRETEELYIQDKPPLRLLLPETRDEDAE